MYNENDKEALFKLRDRVKECRKEDDCELKKLNLRNGVNKHLVKTIELIEKSFDLKSSEETKEKPAKERKVVEAEIIESKENPHDHTKHAHNEDLKVLEKEELNEIKKEHKKETKEKPAKNLKQNIQTEETKEKMSKTMPRSGKK